MPFDGVVTKCVVEELKELLVGGRVEKIFQPEADEILINIRTSSRNVKSGARTIKLVLSASASYPRIHITDISKENPSNPPVFCMLLRKHLTSGKIVDVQFHDYERIVSINIESTDELGDTSVKRLIIEIMGRYSNIILVNSENKILDAIKHVDNEVSSVREVMPARLYMTPPSQGKISPEELDVSDLFLPFHKSPEGCFNVPKEIGNMPVEKFLLNNIKGFSPLLCREVCSQAGVESKMPISVLSSESLESLESKLAELIGKIRRSEFHPCIFFEDDRHEKPLDFHCIRILQQKNIKYFDSISRVLDIYYSAKDALDRLNQKKSVLFKVIGTAMERCSKKRAIQEEKLREVENRELLKLYGELITANIYCIKPGVQSVRLLNYYSSNEEYLEIPLDENLTPQLNAQKYFKLYNKAKSAYNYTTKQLEETLKELDYLASVQLSLENASTLQEIEEIRQELIDGNYMAQKKRSTSRKSAEQSAPLHFKSSEGIDIYAGKNNRQNDELTLKLANSNDIWLHARNIPGSHVIIRKRQAQISESTLLEAATIAAFHSKARFSTSVPVDYTQVKNVKKPSGSKPGMVIYENFRTIMVKPDEEIVKKLMD